MAYRSPAEILAPLDLADAWPELETVHEAAQALVDSLPPGVSLEGDTADLADALTARAWRSHALGLVEQTPPSIPALVAVPDTYLAAFIAADKMDAADLAGQPLGPAASAACSAQILRDREAGRQYYHAAEHATAQAAAWEAETHRLREQLARVTEQRDDAAHLLTLATGAGKAEARHPGRFSAAAENLARVSRPGRRP